MFADLHVRLDRPLAQSVLRAVDRAIAELRRGDLVVVKDGDGSGCLVLAAEAVSTEALALMRRLGGTTPRLILTARRAQAVKLETVDADLLVLCAKSGLSAEQMRELADPTIEPGVRSLGLTVAGCATDGLEGASVRLAKLARLLPTVVSVPLPAAADTAGFARTHDLVAVDAADIVAYQREAARTLRRVAEARVPLEGAEDARVVAFRPSDGGLEHLAIVIGTPDPQSPVLARLHSECFTGDLLGSLRCDCGDQLRGAIAEMGKAGSGVLLYLAQEGRGIGLINKLRAYRLQDTGIDTIDANEHLGFESDERVFLSAAEMLRQLGFGAVRLMTNNPDKMHQLAQCGISVTERVPHMFASNGHNEAYLRAKALRSGHMLPTLEQDA